MRLDLQAKLLRVLQEQEFERVGGTAADSRWTSASSRPPIATSPPRPTRGDVPAGPLLSASSVIPIVIPPLRERPEDIPLLA